MLFFSTKTHRNDEQRNGTGIFTGLKTSFVSQNCPGGDYTISWISKVIKKETAKRSGLFFYFSMRNYSPKYARKSLLREVFFKRRIAFSLI
jgi:hypothetical protein